MFKTPILQFVIEEGRITAFDMHPSGDYLLLSSSKGKVYLFRVDTGELRGTIVVPPHAGSLTVDPSGLYFLISVPPFSDKAARHLEAYGEYLEEDFGQAEHAEGEIERTTLLLYEVGTGNIAAEIRSIFEVSKTAFSADGRCLAAGSKRGCVAVWAIGEHLFDNMKGVLEQAKGNRDFWANYPIFIDD